MISIKYVVNFVTSMSPFEKIKFLGAHNFDADCFLLSSLIMAHATDLKKGGKARKSRGQGFLPLLLQL